MFASICYRCCYVTITLLGLVASLSLLLLLCPSSSLTSLGHHILGRNPGP
jgi:hypothetical protein